jgi:hypothetical protein
MKLEINGYSLTSNWFAYVAENSTKVDCKHTALYLYIVEMFNKRNWVQTIGLPTDFTMGILNIKSYKTYISVFNDLAEFGFIKISQKATNQFTSNQIELVKNTKASSKHLPKQIESTDQLNVSITKHINLETNKPKTNKQVSEFDKQIRATCRNVFLDIYNTKNKSEYYWTPKDATNMNQLIDKIKFKVKEKYPNAEKNQTDYSEKIIASMQHILNGIKDNWIVNNFCYPIINSKFNEIYTQIKLNPNGTNHPKSAEHRTILETALKFIK